MDIEAREAIRIAQAFIPDDLERQRALATEIVGAINLCQADLAHDIMRKARATQQFQHKEG